MSISFRMVLPIIGSLLISGCMFFGLREDVKLLVAATTFSGVIKTTSPRNTPIFVALYQPAGNDQYGLKAYMVRYGPGPFEFLRGGGDYYLIAFEDANEDFTFQPDEYVGWYGTPTLIKARPGVNFTNLEIVLRSPEQAKQELPALYAPNVSRAPLHLDDSRRGEIVALDDPRFSPQVGALGMWEPIKFIQQGHNGLFFFEPYHPDKTPILFIHGLSGSGYDSRCQLNASILPYFYQHDKKRMPIFVVSVIADICCE